MMWILASGTAQTPSFFASVEGFGCQRDALTPTDAKRD